MEMPYYRTFVGIPVRPGPGLLGLRNELMDLFSAERISWVRPDQFHVTLRFIGDVPKSVVKDLGEALRKKVHLPGARDLQLEGVGSFGPRKRPRVVWVGFKESGFFDPLKREVDLALEDCGIPADDHPFNPHLTLGRVRSLKEMHAYHKVIRDLSPRLQEPVRIDRLVFYRSELGPQGARYSILAEYMFGK